MVLIGLVLTVGTCFPAVSYGEPGQSDSTDYEYYDENGYLINEEIEDAVAVNEITPDTSWFNFYRDPDKSYTISTEEQLFGLASLVNEQQAMWKQNRFETFEGVTFELANDIALTHPWTPIGSDDYITFRGVFDGNGYTISGLDVDMTGDYAGFFGYLSGKVKDLKLTGSVRTTGGKAGAFAGYMAKGSKVLRCTSEVSISAGAETGGIAGYNDLGTLRKCINRGRVIGTIKVGGVVGENWGSVSCCGNYGPVTSSQRGMTTYGTGGVAGRSVSVDSSIDCCFNTGVIESATEGTGGIAGYTNSNGASITNSYNTGTVSVKNETSHALDNLTEDTAKGYAGGIVGIVGTKGVKIENCYHAGKILNNQISGGIIGKYENVSKVRDDSYIVNNYYIKQDVNYGVGIDTSGKSRNIRGGTTTVSASSLTISAASLGPHYISDSGGVYGNRCLPVLDWQQPLAEDEVQYLTGIPIDVQQNLNAYMNGDSKGRTEGKTLRLFLGHCDVIAKTTGDENHAN